MEYINNIIYLPKEVTDLYISRNESGIVVEENNEVVVEEEVELFINFVYLLYWLLLSFESSRSRLRDWENKEVEDVILVLGLRCSGAINSTTCYIQKRKKKVDVEER